MRELMRKNRFRPSLAPLRGTDRRAATGPAEVWAAGRWPVVCEFRFRLRQL
jgi:hypothetical protein